MGKESNYISIIIISIICLFIIIIGYHYYKNSDSYQLGVALDASSNNRLELEKALDYYEKGTSKYEAMVFLIKNMPFHLSFDNNHNNRQIQQYDIKNISAPYLINNVKEAYETWCKVPWHDEIDFESFCQNILPYKVDCEPIVEWRNTLKKKYSSLVRGITRQEIAFDTIFYYLKNHFKVKDNKNAFETDVLTLDSLMGGDCRERALHMVYVMRSLGISAVLDYTPFWANQGTNAHYWVSLVTKSKRIHTIGRDSINYIDGVYEPIKYHINYQNYPYSIDSLKKIAKVYRITYNIIRPWSDISSANIPSFMKKSYSKDVTDEYYNLTTKNIVPVKTKRNIPLFVCTFQQGKGWQPIGKAQRLNNNQVDVGPLIHDNMIIIATYRDGTVIPLSNPFLINHTTFPKEYSPQMDSLLKIVLYRKYLVNSRWPNRWGDLIGTTIEVADDNHFNKGVKKIKVINKMPVEKYVASINTANKKYIRILPAKAKYPVPAEIDLINNSGCVIPKDDYRIYAVGKGLTGDTIPVRWLKDNDYTTTFFKQFPYWLGIELTNCKGEVSAIQVILWNDMNRIEPKHQYELFYFDGEWRSLGKKVAESDSLEFKNVPHNSILLLRDYTKGKEERIFTYENDKQIWW